jgi:methylmalonyl-CoA/ethylmalonyl-CoA epimerase
VRIGEAELELMHSADPESAVGRFLGRRGPGVHHVAYEVGDLDAELERLRERGYEIVGDVRTGVHGTRVAFVHPRSMGGVLTELVEREA